MFNSLFLNILLYFTHLDPVEALNRIGIGRIYQTSLPRLRYEFRHFIILPEA